MMTAGPEKTIFDEAVADQCEETIQNRAQRPVLIVLDENEANRRIPVLKRELILGRDLMCDIALHDSRCSRRHARMVYENFNDPVASPLVRVHDLDSTNGTFVNGTRVSDHLLQDRDKILIGSSVIGFFLRDESELAVDQRLFQLASQDPLTGLSNRGVFDVEIKQEFDRAIRYGRRLALVMFDIDHFKRFNDTYGHPVGDFVLRELAALIQTKVRGNDICTRYGGEEFAIILPETSREGALIQAERLREAVEHHSFERDGHTLTLTISVGIASIDGGYRSAEEMINAADRALYSAKAGGRNKVCIASEAHVVDLGDKTGGGFAI
ncbi:MAG TPA: GGDEF domain-containing protein [Candidatus Sumerlaeota bacterium]|nr:GGDEF domain-containing protein [Candidatus Sumerlaeota bacterium]HOR27168.1 GGDEF domain-containing protein [Candidatus Sumerlaeota bacterium]HPK01508.1 GGDEF domain-containing protein [Candidatus Sumerlaeota bacterium]